MDCRGSELCNRRFTWRASALRPVLGAQRADPPRLDLVLKPGCSVVRSPKRTCSPRRFQICDLRVFGQLTRRGLHGSETETPIPASLRVADHPPAAPDKRYGVTADVSRTRAGRVCAVSGPGVTVRAEIEAFYETEICDFRRDRARAACSAPPRKPRGPTRQRAFGFETEL